MTQVDERARERQIEGTDTDDALAAVAPGRRRRFSTSIQSKLLVMLLAVTVVTAGVVGLIGYRTATTSLRHAALEQLTSVRETRGAELRRLFTNIQQAVVISSSNDSSRDASVQFNAAFAQLGSERLAPKQEADLDTLYTKSFVPELEQRSGNTYAADAFEPKTPAARYVQAYYTAPDALDYDKAIAVDDAGDGSDWTRVNAHFNPYFRSLTTEFGFDDVLMLDTHGNVVYSAYKGVDLGTNLETGPYQDTALADAYQTVLKTNTLDAVQLTDFDRYIPSLDVPTMWAVSPIGSDGHITGALAFQIPIELINGVTTGNEGWAKQGLGKTGEVYLVGPDMTMRSASRELIQHPEDYARDVVANGTSPAVARRVVQVKGTILLQPSRTKAVTAALRGETGTVVGTSYLGGENLAAYAPLDVDGLNWVVVARMDTSEAYAPVTDFARKLGLSTAAIVLVVALLSLVLAQVFLRPVRRLSTGVRRVAAGELGAQVDTGTRDEIAELGDAFNDMSRSLKIKADLLDAEQAEHERLLLSLMPQDVAQRYREGEETIAQDHQDVTVIFADILGLDDYTRDLPSEQGLAVLNGILRSFDEAAERLGVERVRTTRQEGYLASCGLVVPRVDSARRTVEFAVEAQRILDRFGAQNGAHLNLRAGIDTGTVTSGLVGRSSVVFDMWGDAVNLAHRIHDAGRQPGIVVTQRVVDGLPDTVPLEEAGTVETRTGEQRVWKVDPGADRD